MKLINRCGTINLNSPSEKHADLMKLKLIIVVPGQGTQKINIVDNYVLMGNVLHEILSSGTNPINVQMFYEPGRIYPALINGTTFMLKQHRYILHSYLPFKRKHT